MDCSPQAPWSKGFCRHEYWSGLLFPSPGESSQPRDRTWVSRIVGRRFTVWACQLNWTELSKLWWGLRFHPACKLPSQPDSFMAAVWGQKAPWASASCWCCRLPCSRGAAQGAQGDAVSQPWDPSWGLTVCRKPASLVFWPHTSVFTQKETASLSPRLGDMETFLTRQPRMKGQAVSFAH